MFFWFHLSFYSEVRRVIRGSTEQSCKIGGRREHLTNVKVGDLQGRAATADGVLLDESYSHDAG